MHRSRLKGWQVARGSARGPQAATASATSARSPQRGASTNSSGVWAPPPRGPSPSTVSGIAGAKWLASLAPPRATPTIRRPSRALGSLEQRRGRRARVHPRPDPLHPSPRARRRRASRAPPPSTVVERLDPVGAQVEDQLAARGHDVERVAGAHHGRDDAQAVGAVSGVVQPASSTRGLAPAPAARSRPGRARCPSAPARPVASARSVPAALRRTTTPSSPSWPPLAGLEAQAGVVAGEALDVGERLRAPLLVGHQQHRQLGERLRARRPAPARPRARARRRPSCRPCRVRRAARRRAAAGACASCPITVSR